MAARDGPDGLRDLRVLDFSTEIAGPYATKLLAEAGASVVKLEAAEDPLRRFSATGAEVGDAGALYLFLNGAKCRAVGGPDDPDVTALLARADLVVESGAVPALEPAALLERFPSLVVLSITPFGRTGPFAGRAATEFTLQAESGSLSLRGRPDQPPFAAAGRIADWVGGTYAAVAALAAVRGARRSGRGDHVDFSLLEVMNIAGTVYADLTHELAGRPPLKRPPRSVEIPSIEPTSDGWVGFTTNSRQQYQDFLRLIERPDLLADEELAAIGGRTARYDEWNAIVRAWTCRHSTREIVDRAAAFRIPVAPVHDGRTVLEHEHFRARGVFVKNLEGGFLQPRPPFRIDGQALRPDKPGGTSAELWRERRAPQQPSRPSPPSSGLPLAGIRVLDGTAWWAGPAATQMLATLGAEVIHLESIQRPDGMRMAGGAFVGRERWWEYSSIYLSANTNKLGITLDLASEAGLELLRRLLGHCDVLVENFSPRVFDNFGLDWPALHAHNPRLVFVRMPAFGLDGPWRDHVGFAQTMEQISGMAWITGHPDDQPRIPRGPCDPLAGMHAAFATLVALQDRERSGRGHLVEVPMVEGALNAAAEQIVEYSAYGCLMRREGNRSPHAAPQGLYACRGAEQWLALSVATDAQWRVLVAELGSPPWAEDPALGTRRGRRAAHDRIDAELARWAADRDLDATVKGLVARGVPAARVEDARGSSAHPQLVARSFFEPVDHPIVGRHAIAGAPFRLRSHDAPWNRSHAPTLGQHNRDLLRTLLGLSDERIRELESDAVIGDRPQGL